MTANPSTMNRLTILQGDARASRDPHIVMSTILGSCVCTCLYDPEMRIGGMNHFLLAEPRESAGEDAADSSYGLYLMEVLINDMLKQGASKARLKARLYGGANMHADLGAIGAMNAAFARKFLAMEKIPLVHEDLEGDTARRVQFRPAAGLVRVQRIVAEAAAPIPTQKPADRGKADLGSVELF